MSVENIDSEGTQLSDLEGLAADLEERSSSDWNGRSVGKAQLDRQFREMRDIIFLSHTAAEMRPLSASLNATAGLNQGTGSFSLVTQEYSPESHQTDFILYGENVDGKVSVSGSADTEGNTSADVRVGISSKDGNISGSISGSVSRDKDGHTEGEVKFETEVSF